MGVPSEKAFHFGHGLQTAKDDLEAPPGALEVAEDAEYRRGRVAIGPAKGRVYAGGVAWSEGHGSHSTDAIRGLAALAWDPGTTVDEATPELAQILYQTRGAGSAHFSGVRTVPAADSPSDAGLRAAGSRELVAGYTLSPVPPSPTEDPTFDTAAFENEHVVAGLGVVRRGATGQRMIRHGGILPERQFIRVVSAVSLSAIPPVAPVALQAGGYFYWWTWVIAYGTDDEVEGPEGDFMALGPAIDPAVNLNEVQNGYIGFTAHSSEIWVLFAADPSDPKKLHPSFIKPGYQIRLYRSLRIPLSYGGSSQALRIHHIDNQNPFPVGYRIADINPALPSLAYPNSDTTRLQYVTSASYKLAPFHVYRDLDSEVLTQDLATANLRQAGRPDFKYVSVRLGNDQASVARDGVPPKSSAYEVFEESLVANDLDDPRKTRFSFPGRVHSFPAIFYINHESRQSDRVVGYRVVRNVLGVFLRYGVERVNWLPRESDVDFSRGRVREILSDTRGCVSVFALDKFQHPTLGEMVAFCSDDGVWATDLINPQFMELTRGVKWGALVGDPAASILVNDPDSRRLLLAHTGPGDQGVIEQSALRPALSAFYYGPEYLDSEGRPALLGPVGRPGGISRMVRVTTTSGKRVIVTADARGSLFYEGLGFFDEATRNEGDGTTGAPLSFFLRTKKVYPAGLLGEVEIGQVGLRGRGLGPLRVRVTPFIGGVPDEPRPAGRELVAAPSTQDPVRVGQGTSVANRFDVELRVDSGGEDVDAVAFAYMADAEIGEREG